MKMKQKEYTLTKQISGIWLQCDNPICRYNWRYTGRFFLYATCPSCRRNIRIGENRIEKSPQQSVEVGRHSQTAAAFVGGTTA
jgi:hypothetical protein